MRLRVTILCVLCVGFGLGLKLVLAADMKNGYQKELLTRFEFEKWGNASSSPTVFHWGVDLASILGPEYVLNSHLGRSVEKGEGSQSFVAYDEASFVTNRSDADIQEKRSREQDTPVYNVLIYECRSGVAARTMLCYSMTVGAAGPAPNRCMEGVDVGDKCFTGNSIGVPSVVYFCRGNVVVTVRSSVSVLPIAKAIDEALSCNALRRARASIDAKSKAARESSVKYKLEKGGAVTLLDNGVKDVFSLSAIAYDGEVELVGDRLQLEPDRNSKRAPRVIVDMRLGGMTK